jgi:putative glycosyltransferase (TIGR04372 family)
MSLPLRNTLYKRCTSRIKKARDETKHIRYVNGKRKNIKHIKMAIFILFPIVPMFREVYFPVYLLCLIISLPVVILVRLVRPIVHIRFGRVYGSGFGQCALSSELYLSRKKSGLDIKNTLDLFFFEGNVPNQQLAKMIRRKMVINPLVQPFYDANLLMSGWKEHLIKLPPYYPERDVEFSFLEVPPQLSFRKEELEQVEAELLKYGMNIGNKFICLYVRDAGYQLNSVSLGFCHDINQCGFIIDRLVKEGYYVLRMGKAVEKPLAYSHPRVVDYGCKFHSDLMDVWLTANCEIFINAGGGGLSALAAIYRRPLVCFNYDIFDFWSTSVNSLVSFRRFIKDGNRMAVSDILDVGYRRLLRGLLADNKYTDIQIENQPEYEILELIDEMLSRLNGSWETDNDLEDMQDEFWSMLQGWDEFHCWHGEELLCKVGHNYMLQNQDWLLK